MLRGTSSGMVLTSTYTKKDKFVQRPLTKQKYNKTCEYVGLHLGP